MRSSGRVKPEAAFRNSTSQLVPSVRPEETLAPARLITSAIACGQSSLRRASASCTSAAPRSASSMKVPIITFTNGIGYSAAEEIVVHAGGGEARAVAERGDIVQGAPASIIHHVANLRLVRAPRWLVQAIEPIVRGALVRRAHVCDVRLQ